MRTHSRSLRPASELDPISRVVLEFEDAWRGGPPPIDRYRGRFEGGDSSYGLAELVKADLKQRYGRGERPSAREYLDRFPELAGEDGRALSLIYEEYCLRAEADGPVDASEFCRAYPSWRDSLVSQLAYHRALSRAVEPEPGPEPAEFPEVGDRFGDYELVKLLGEGAAARVFLGRAILLGGKEFAIKVSPDRGGEPAILGRLSHPNIVPVLSSFVDAKTGLRGLCMPYRPGPTLDAVIRRFRRDGIPRKADGLRVPVAPASIAGEPEDGGRPGGAGFPASGTYAAGVAWIGLKIARALAHAHGRGFFHRDVKPDNVLLSVNDGPQLFDFNLAHDPELADQARAAHRGGTLPYMAREHLEAFLDPTLWQRVGAAADIFSLGLILRELLTVERPWKPPGDLNVPRAVNAMLLHRTSPLAPIRLTNPDVPHGLEAIVARCLMAAPDDRYRSASDLALDLANYLARRPLAHATNPSLVESAANRVARVRSAIGARAIVPVVFLLCLVMTVIAVLAANRGARPVVVPPPTSDAPIDSTASRLDRAARREAAGDLLSADEDIQEATRRDDYIDAFEDAIKRHPGSIAIRMGFGTSYLKKQRLDDAERIFREVLDRWKDHHPALYALANVEFSRGNYEAAVALSTRAIAICEASALRSDRDRLSELWLVRSQSLIKRGDALNDSLHFHDAEPLFTRALVDVEQIPLLRSDGLENPNAAFSREFLSASAEIGRGTSMRGQHLDDAASGSYRIAQGHLNEARRHGGEKYRKNVEALAGVLERKVAELKPRPEAAGPDRADPPGQ